MSRTIADIPARRVSRRAEHIDPSLKPQIKDQQHRGRQQ